jgi:hypothetical protein
MTRYTDRKLFTPVQVGPVTLLHRVVMTPLTRSRSEQPGDIPGNLMLEYYTQRASEGGLIISEATSISIAGRGWFGAPGMYSDEQVAGWKKITAAIHAKGGRYTDYPFYDQQRDGLLSDPFCPQFHDSPFYFNSFTRALLKLRQSLVRALNRKTKRWSLTHSTPCSISVTT